MKLHQNNQLYIDLIRFTADKMGIKPIYVEKDYWVMYVLYRIFNNEIGQDTVFKGGTALSKCNKIINRFSEDIDLVVIRREGESDNKLKTKLKALSQTIEDVLPEVQIENVTRKMGMNRKTAHSYSKSFEGNYGQVRDVIILEATWLGYYEPYTSKMISSFIGEVLLENGQTAIAESNGLLPFEVQVLKPIRTLCEKIMSLVRFSYGENPIDDLKKKIRHAYDIHQLLKQKEFFDFFNSPDFEDMLLKVAQDDVVSFKNNNTWLNYHPVEALIFKDLANVWGELVNVYNGEFRNLVYGDFPNSIAVFDTLNTIQERLKTIIWTIRT